MIQGEAKRTNSMLSVCIGIEEMAARLLEGGLIRGLLHVVLSGRS